MSLLWGRPAARAGVESRALSFGDVFAQGGDVVGYGDVAAHSSLVPLFAAHREIIDAVAGVPLRGYRRAGDGTLVEMSDDPSIIRPVVGTRYTWVQQCVASLLSDGNAYGLPTGVGAGGWPDRVMWTDPADWSIDDTELIPRYYYRGRSFAPTEIVHIPWIQRPGRWEGISPLRAFREAWEAGESAQTVAKSWFSGGAIPSGHLKNIAQTLDATSSAAAKSLFRAAVRGRWSWNPHVSSPILVREGIEDGYGTTVDARWANGMGWPAGHPQDNSRQQQYDRAHEETSKLLKLTPAGYEPGSARARTRSVKFSKGIQRARDGARRPHQTSAYCMMNT
jgi:hypothetical protein